MRQVQRGFYGPVAMLVRFQLATTIGGRRMLIIESSLARMKSAIPTGGPPELPGIAIY